MNIILLFILVKICHVYSVWTLRRSEEIHDMGHSVLPVLPMCMSIVPDIIVVFVFMWSVFLHRNNLQPLLMSHIVMIILRIITMHLTVLPPVKSFKCTNNNPYNFNTLYNCTQDYLFSGHTAITTMSLLYIASVSRTIWYPWLTLIGIFQMFFIVGLRSHYTIDVLLGALLSFFVFHYNNKLPCVCG